MKVYNKEIDDGVVHEICELVRKKRELTYLDDVYIAEHIKKYFEQNVKSIAIINESKNLEKNAEAKKLVKFVREKAHDVYGMFQEKTISLRENLLDGYTKEKNSIAKLEILKQILKSHISTKERMDYMEELYAKIFSIAGKPSSIMDLGCGLNPLTLPFMHLDEVNYIASDFNQKDMDFLQAFFYSVNIDGIAVRLDLLKDYDKLSEYNVDICFLFKVLDSLEKIRLNVSYEIMKSINAEYVIISFPLKTLSGKKEMTLRNRNWFEKVLDRTGYSYETFDMGNELFYVAKKNLTFR